MRKSFVCGAGLFGLAMVLAAFRSGPTPTPAIQEVIVTVEVPVVITRVVEVQVTVEPPTLCSGKRGLAGTEQHPPLLLPARRRIKGAPRHRPLRLILTPPPTSIREDAPGR